MKHRRAGTEHRAFMSLYPEERCCAASLLALLPLLPSFRDRRHPSEPKQNKPIPLNWLFLGIWSQEGGSNLTSSPQVPWHNKSIQEAKKSQKFVLCPLSPVPALLLQPAASLLQPLPSGTVNSKPFWRKEISDLPPSLTHPAGPLSRWDPGMWAEGEEQLRKEAGCSHACSRQQSFSPEAEKEQKKTSLIRSHCPRHRPALGLT